MSQYGRKKDAGAYSLMSLESGPFLTMVTLGVAGLSAFPWQALVGAILPLVLGLVIGNLDHSFRDLFAPVVPGLIPSSVSPWGSRSTCAPSYPRVRWASSWDCSSCWSAAPSSSWPTASPEVTVSRG